MTNMLDDRPWIEKDAPPGKPRVYIGTLSVRRWVAVVAMFAVVVGGPLGVSYVRALTVPGGAPSARGPSTGCGRWVAPGWWPGWRTCTTATTHPPRVGLPRPP